MEEADWEPSSGSSGDQVSTNSIVFVCVAIDEVELWGKVKNAGTWWNPKKKLWENTLWQGSGIGSGGANTGSKMHIDIDAGSGVCIYMRLYMYIPTFVG